MIHAEDEKARAIRGAFAVFAAGLADSKLVSAQRVLGPKIARTDAVSAAEQTRRFLRRERRQFTAEFVGLEGFAQRDANIARQRIVASEALIGALDNDD